MLHCFHSLRNSKRRKHLSTSFQHQTCNHSVKAKKIESKFEFQRLVDHKIEKRVERKTGLRGWKNLTVSSKFSIFLQSQAAFFKKVVFTWLRVFFITCAQHILSIFSFTVVHVLRKIGSAFWHFRLIPYWVRKKNQTFCVYLSF